MSFQIIVCVKQVPGTMQVEIDPDTGTLIRDGVESKLNPYDLYALEAALSLAGAYGGGVTAISMGPPSARSALQEAIYMGADAGVLISDRRFAGADTLATAYTLSQAIRDIGDYDLILCGKQTTDGDTAQVGAELAEFLGIPHACGVLSAEPCMSGGVILQLNYDEQIITQWMRLPCLICMEGGINTPRLPSLKRKKSLTSEPLRTISLDNLVDADESHYGLSGSPTHVEALFSPEKRSEREIYSGSAAELGAKLAELLIAHI